MILTDKQDRALEKLANAFKACKAAGIVFVGMDSSLLAFDQVKLIADGYREQLRTGKGGHAAMREQNGGHPVETHDTYLDSGGW